MLIMVIEMIIYLELFLFTNLLIHVLSIIVIGKLINLRISKGIIISGIIDIIWMLVYVYYYDFFHYLRYFVGAFLVMISYQFRPKELVEAIILYYLFNFLLGGVGFCLNVSGNLFYFLVMISYILISISIYLILVNKKYETYYDVSFVIGKKRTFKAFFDTGCNLVYCGYPVLIISKKKEFRCDFVGKLKIYGATGSMDVDVFKIDSLFVNGKKHFAYGVFLDVEFEAIIGVSFV